MTVAFLLAGSVVFTAGGTMAGARNDTAYETLRVGVTGILCYRKPCPWNGVTRDDATNLPAGVIWSGHEPPPMIASPEDAARLAADYAEGCNRITGRMVEGTLEVAEVIGPCWPAPGPDNTRDDPADGETTAE